jgi:hypothetical protein
LTDARITLAGTARDGAGVLQIEAENVTSGGAQLASGAERWRAELELVAGPNTVRVRSVDQAFNVSPWVTRFFTRVVTLPLTVRTNGQGSVSPNLNGRLLEIGKTYRLTAKPARGQNFDRWEGATYQGATLEFVMQSNLVLTANFVPNPFTNSSGPYSGLVVETNTHAPAGNGLVTVQVAESGAFSGRLRVAGRNYSFRGFFDLDGFGHGTVLRPAQTPIVLAMQLDLTGQTGTITGSATDGSWVADLLCYRNPYAAGANPSPYAGTRIFLWRADGTDALVAGTELKVNARGQAALKATFTDGRRASASSSVSQEGRIPVAFSSDRLDSLVGWASVGLSGDPRVVGDGILIPAGKNGSPTTLTIQPLAP